MEKFMRMLEPRSAVAVVFRIIIFTGLIALTNVGFSILYPFENRYSLLYYVVQVVVVGGPFVAFFFVMMMFQIRLQRHLSRLSRKDGLTGLNNRNTFMELAERRHRTSLSGILLLLDADHFKRINDNYGHQTGDNCLQSIAYTLRRSLREHDVVGRIGGEEFAIYLSNTTLVHARAIAERFTQPITFKSALDQAPLSVTLSVGAIETAPDMTLSEMLGLADRGLYHAKATGRAKMVVWSEQQPEQKLAIAH